MKRRELLRGLLAGAGLVLTPAPLKALGGVEVPMVYGALPMGTPSKNVVIKTIAPKRKLIMSPQSALLGARRYGKTAAMMEQIREMFDIEVAIDPLCPTGTAYLVDGEGLRAATRKMEQSDDDDQA